MADLKVNSMRIRFDRGSAEPSEADIFSFMRDKLKLRCDDLLSMYKEKNSMSVIIKFKSEDDLMKALERLPGSMDFVYDKYRSCKVQISAANAVVRYIRLFNLPPEVEDKEIWNVMSKYGKIQRMVHEKYGAETGFPIWSSVRGVYMELKEGEEIPGIVNVRNIQARVYYQGLLNKCFQCGSIDHIKVDCPARKSVNERIQQVQSGSYSSALKGHWSKSKQNTTQKMADENRRDTMTNLNELVASSSYNGGSSAATKMLSDIVGQSATSTPINDEPGCSQPIGRGIVDEEAGQDDNGKAQQMEAGGASSAAAPTSDEHSTQNMEADGGSLAEEGGKVSQQMETDELSLKRSREDEGQKSNEESDECSLSDTLDFTKAGGEEKVTLSGWQTVVTRNRSKQMKMSQKGRSKSASGN